MQKVIVRREVPANVALIEGLHPVLQRIYATRGVQSSDELQRGANALARPTAMKDISAAVELLYQALVAQQHVVIVGDYDADGATSTALMMLALRSFGFKQLTFLVPNRFDFGYGLSPEMANVVIEHKADLLVTVDNGISCIAGVERAKAAGIKVLITDHHLPGEQLPNADAIVNPNQNDCGFPSTNLAGVGVAFYLMSALRTHLIQNNWFAQQGIAEPKTADLLDLVALGTVADVVPLDANNRILVHQGLQRIRSGHCRPGIQALIEVANREQRRLAASDMAFALGPRLNAAGRLDDMTLGISCLLCDDIYQARIIASQLDEINIERREIEASMQTEAERIVRELQLQDDIPDAFCLYQDDWHPGVVGIVAGRIKDKYHRPVIAFAQHDEEEVKGSARTIPGLHIRDILEEIATQNPGLIVKFGGHAMAAGLSVRLDKLPEFRQKFDALVRAKITDEQRTMKLLSDGELASDLFTVEFAEYLKDSGPWGQAFPEPVFDGYFTIAEQRIVGKKHLKLVLQHPNSGLLIDAIHFNVDLNCWPDATVRHVHAAYQLDVNTFRNQTNIQLMIQSLKSERSQ